MASAAAHWRPGRHPTSRAPRATAPLSSSIGLTARRKARGCTNVQSSAPRSAWGITCRTVPAPGGADDRRQRSARTLGPVLGPPRPAGFHLHRHAADQTLEGRLAQRDRLDARPWDGDGHACQQAVFGAEAVADTRETKVVRAAPAQSIGQQRPDHDERAADPARQDTDLPERRQLTLAKLSRRAAQQAWRMQPAGHAFPEPALQPGLPERAIGGGDEQQAPVLE